MTNEVLTQTDERTELARIVRVIEPSPSTDTAVDALVNQALAAHRQIEGWSEARIDALLHALGRVVADHASPLAVAAVAETGMGNVRDKTLKNSIASTGVCAQLAGHIGHGQIAFDRERQIAEIANPVGVVVGLVPATHPVATFIFKVLIAIKGRNAIILSPSRRAQQVSHQVGVLIQQVLRDVGAPTGLVQWLGADSSRATTTALMSHRQVGMVLATGGHAMVQAAYRSGTPAIGVGPGNAPVLISADADLRHAARSIVLSKSFDNGLICGAENHLVVEASARGRLIAELIQQGAAVLTRDESARFRDAAVNPQTLRLLPSIFGKDAATLARLANIERPHDIQLLVIPTEIVSTRNYLAAEKLAPVVSLFTVAGVDEGMRVCRALLDVDGAGHTAIIHSRSSHLIERFATIPVSRILINSPATQGLLGLTTGLVPSLTLGCGTWGGTSTTNSVTYSDLLNITRVAYDIFDHGVRSPS
ncbi:MAG TPA: aldehyde dehydrogenase family protein [Vicinamibacterales bacterium]|nr:aldehyde dehydrogenase family protein [Vicinamibacterales bacterium]